jgi:hypothetical protein
MEVLMTLAGGCAVVASTPGEGTEVELTLPVTAARSEA